MKSFDALESSHLISKADYKRETPLRSPVLTTDQLWVRGSILAEEDIGSGVEELSKTPSRELRDRFKNNCKVLEQAYITLSDAARNKELLTPGAEWLLDNYHILDQHIREVRRHFPAGYDRRLPKLLSGDLKGYPRVYHIALELIIHSDAAISTDLLSTFVNSYQERSVLTLGELWAIPLMLKFALVENLRRLISGIVSGRDERRRSAEMVNQLFSQPQVAATDALLTFAKQIESNPAILDTGAVYLVRRLRERGPRAVLTLQWLEERLRERNLDPDTLLREDHQNQAFNQISIGNSVTSLRSMGSIDWRTWVESVSTVHKILSKETSKVYQLCDFNTRDLYRHRIEKLARRVHRHEREIAERLVAFTIADDGSTGNQAAAQSHIGYYLIDNGKRKFEQSIGYAPTASESIGRIIKRVALPAYLSLIILITAAIATSVFSGFDQTPLATWVKVLLVGLFVIPASDVAISFLQWISSHLAPPAQLPKLDFAKGVPDECRTLLAIQAIFDDKASLTKVAESLEVRYLANEDANLFFAIIADLPDRPTLTAGQDEEIMQHGQNLIADLNARYAKGSNTNRFFILFRERKWNPSEGKFMGWERKRGKVCELNRLILGKGNTSFILEPGVEELFRTFKYVLTLDTDTQIPYGNAVKMIGTIAHPLNRAVVDPKRRIVTRGYGILQPRVGISLMSASATTFSRIFAGHAGLDPYTNTISDFYQDLFDEGSFYGKGIYDVAAFEKTLHGRVPENAVLSHDLFEGQFARVGLVSDVEFIDEFPARYSSYAKRAHRWVRGDWQLLPWIGWRIPNDSRDLYRSPLSGLGRLKLIDNLRRSLIAPSLMAFLLCSWLIVQELPLFWAALSMLVIAFPVYMNVAQIFIMPPVGLHIGIFAKGFGVELARLTQQAVLSFIFLPHQALLMLHAIGVTLYRVYISKTSLLEWQTAAHSERRAGSQFQGLLNEMSKPSLLIFAIGAVLYLLAPLTFALVFPILTLWVLAPYIAFKIGRLLKPSQGEILPEERNYLWGIAYDTWSYFRDNNSENNDLIPDNIQLQPAYVSAERTSPTNIAMYYGSCLSAYELGFESIPGITRRISDSFNTLSKMELYRGHLLNWYHTKTLQPLYPRYVSFVDSGNLAAIFIAVRESFAAYYEAPMVHPSFWEHLTLMCEPLKARFAQVDPAYLTLEAKQLSGALVSRLAAQAKREQLPRAELKIIQQLEDLSAWAKLLMELPEDSGARVRLETLLNLAHSAPLSPRTLRLLLVEVNDREKTGDLDEFPEFIAAISLIKKSAITLLGEMEEIITASTQMLENMDFSFLFDEQKNLFTVGFNVDDSRRDAGHYDLLASESRLGSLVCIAKRDVPDKHWFALGRQISSTSGGKSLLSWSGTMFEFLMPILLMKDYQSTLLSESYKTVVETQRRYAKKHGVVWGISESAYSGVDLESTYQYRAFGVPGLGLKRGLENDLVISPYSTFLALPVAPAEALRNIRQLELLGLRDKYGFFEAVDFTPERLTEGESFHIVKSVFAHHQGMSILAMTNLLRDGVMQHRFHSDPIIKSVDLLLQEKFPQRVTLSLPQPTDPNLMDRNIELQAVPPRSFNTPHTKYPRTQVLSNGRLTTMVDNSGSGFTIFEKEIALSRWREDALTNRYGSYIFVRDLQSKDVWSTGYQPTCVEPDYYEAIFNSDKIEIKRRDSKIVINMEVTVAPDHDVEVRRVTISNLSQRKRVLELTSFGEVVLGHARGDAAHPAFSKMFVESEYLPESDTLLFSRRPRSVKESPLFMFHSVCMKTVWDRTQYESSRAAFVGRGNSIRNAKAMREEKLPGNTGFVLDPIFSLRVRIELEPNTTETVSFITGISRNREEVVSLAERYLDNLQVTRAFEMAWSQSSVELRNEQFNLQQTQIFQALSNGIIFSMKELRGADSAIKENRLTQSALWRLGISGDLPIVLAHVSDPAHTKLVQELILAHYYLRTRGITFDLVVLNEYPGGYFQNFHEELEGLLRSGAAFGWVEKKGGIFLKSLSQLSHAEATLLEALARVSLKGAEGSLGEQLLAKESRGYDPIPETFGAPAVIGAASGAGAVAGATASGTIASVATGAVATGAVATGSVATGAVTTGSVTTGAASSGIVSLATVPTLPSRGARERTFDNALGGFTQDGKGYELQVKGEVLPPLPWSNVIANPTFGTLVTESGGGYTWSENSRENRLTPWSNDPITDPLGEAIYIRDTETGEYWSPTPKPVPSAAQFSVEHLFGKTTFQATISQIESSLSISVAPKESLKWYELSLKNRDRSARKLELFFYVDWVLGVTREDSYRHVVTGWDASAQSLYAISHYNNEFANRAAYIGSSSNVVNYTADRAEFIGRNRDLSSPLALDQPISAPNIAFRSVRKGPLKLSQNVGAALEPCGLIKVAVDLAPGESRTVLFYLGEAPSLDALKTKSLTFRTPATYAAHQEENERYWRKITSAIRVETPCESFNTLMNGWLLYQTVGCRLFARTGFYQSGGALGFRDQLQDTLAVLTIAPEITRTQILIHAARQFVEGDVQHWWHPPTGRGVRTKISDDLLWLPYVVARYIETTGDTSILNEQVPYIEGASLGESHEAYIVPNTSLSSGTITDHCLRAIERSLAVGAHGLPLIGTGDWNDGMNEVGQHGKGESVWLGWFLAHVLRMFVPYIAQENPANAKRFLEHADKLVAAIEKEAWDGEWYIRAFFDDGKPLGSHTLSECRIDSLAQTWSIITGLGDEKRAETALDSVFKHLVNRDAGIISLLTPAFDKSDLEPGYIKGYIPGVRENGGQYTHAGAWVVIAAAMMGRGKDALEAFELMNPINHTATRDKVDVYRGEPYAICGDVYGVAPHEGRAGWSWYTGSSGWLYQAGLHWIIGLKVENQELVIDPCIPADWKEFKVLYQANGLRAEIQVKNSSGRERGVKSVTLNGAPVQGNRIPLRMLAQAPELSEVLVEM